MVKTIFYKSLAVKFIHFIIRDMKRNVLLNSLMIWLGIILIASVLSQASAAVLPASVVKETRDISAFTRLDISGAFEVFLVQGNTSELIIEADEEIIDRIVTRVSGGELEIFVKGTIRSHKTMKAYITFKELSEIELSGAVNLDGGNVMQFDKLDLELSGSCEVVVEMEAKSLDLDLSGASKLTIDGVVGFLDADCSGACKLYLAGLKATTVNFDCSGASTAEFWVTESLDVEGSGASNVHYKGEPKTVNVNTSGASSVKKI
jgi:hypothetical protein